MDIKMSVASVVQDPILHRIILKDILIGLKNPTKLLYNVCGLNHRIMLMNVFYKQSNGQTNSSS